MKRLSILLVMIGGIVSAGEFTDLDGYQYAHSVRYLQQAGVVKGYPDGTFGIDRSVTRAEMMKIVLEARFDETLSPSDSSIVKEQRKDMKNCFTDVIDQRFAPYICYAAHKGMVKGVGNRKFGPDQPVTLAQGLKIAINVFGGMGIQEGEGDGWYQPFLDRAHNNNVFSKYALYPDAPMTRGQMAYLIHQLMLADQGDRDFDNVRDPIFSPGCMQQQPRSIPTFIVDGLQYSAIVDIPNNYDPSQPNSLVIARHGRTNSNAELREYLKLNRVVDDAIVIYPLALPESGSSRRWNMITDLTFFDTIIQQISQNYCINMDEIYVIGHSLGASWTNWLSCVRGDVIRGMGSVGGGLMTRKVTCSGPVEAMIMHHPDDNLVSYAGGQAARDLLLQQNRCDVDSATPVPGAPSKSNCVQYECLADAPVIWCPHTESNTWGYYYPHTWPSFASKMIWDFWKNL